MQVSNAKLSDWHRLYNELGAAQQRLAIAGRNGCCDARARARLQSQVTRLQRESDTALQALRAALTAADKHSRP